MITSPAGVLAVLAGIAAALFLVQRRWKPKLFDLFPPLLFIYALPILLTNLGVTPAASPAYDVLKTYGLPAFLVLMLIDVDVGAAVKVMGKGVIVMLVASVGVVVGALVAFLLVGGAMGEGATSTSFHLSPAREMRNRTSSTRADSLGLRTTLGQPRFGRPS